ncbi:hypothetical protein A2886_02850 [candidate division WWE3 bacterium RIFCSPHIGHO2_01_FULL_42_13]|uniref:N-acetyltransferase domain-containing protein n=1 Tax=candidate division WWE3 bacterium RIFCSPHIGHO2_01_FULL_42_13 TaxID=1802617 RepID=A0A1F4USC1_UNCKA|nr:MAG: hypothetical protein A2886_02850 [candidate division WWE3 bacterium RIFCSPHIGHO2_01_FULL_42_13]
MGKWRNLGSVSTELDGFELVTIWDPEDAIGTRTNLVTELSYVASEGFGKEKGGTEIKEHILTGQTRAFVLTKNKTAIAFAAVKNLTDICNGVYLTGIAMLPEFQGLGIGSFLMKKALVAETYDLMALHTQSPIMYLGLLKLSTRVYPSWEHKIPKSIRKIGEAIVAGKEGFNKMTFVRIGQYKQFLYAKFPWSNNRLANEFFRKQLLIENGETTNGFLVIGMQK